MSANDQDDHLENTLEPASGETTPFSPPPSFRSHTSSPSRHLLSSDPIATEAERNLADTFDDGSDSDDDGHNEGDDRQRLMRANTIESETEQRTVCDGNRPELLRTVTRFPGASPVTATTVPARPAGAPFNSFSQNDGVFANLNAKPERGEEKEEQPPVSLCPLDVSYAFRAKLLVVI